MGKGELKSTNTTMSFAIPKKLKEEIGIVAQKENRSMSNLIVTLLENYVQLNKQPDRLTIYHKLISDINNM